MEEFLNETEENLEQTSLQEKAKTENKKEEVKSNKLFKRKGTRVDKPILPKERRKLWLL